MPERLVVVGASLAGLRAIESARRAGFGGAITLVGAEEHLPYDRPPLSKAFLADDAPGGQPVPFRSRAHLVTELGVELLLGVRAVGVDGAARSIALADGRELPFTRAVLSTGAHVRRLPTVGDGPGVHHLRTWDDAVALKEALRTARRILVVGAGFIGSEVASAAVKRGCEVVMVEVASSPLERAFGAEMGIACVDLHTRAGVDVRLGVAVVSVGPGDGGLLVELSSGDTLRVDRVVVGVGAAPTTGWLEGSGIAVDNGIVCDASLESSVSGVFVAGDVARWQDAASGHSLRLENWTAAAEQGQLAGRRAAGGPPETYRPVAYFWSDWHTTRIQMLGTSVGADAEVVDGCVEDGRWVAGYRRGDALVGLLSVGMPAETMKYRTLVAAGAGWDDVLRLAADRREKRTAALR
ncbi:NAD(P)/FAD-dependent oxidoreductase [Micromonospora sp. HUAS LYJ1]|uniref:NAD(P)/FAD-dependent oxidoreductase n=1 Tax=Micromonospora sp. HUAS LYJ1 TaxID=3061626 RepID=UPI002671FAA6|nr:FAD-dependent oxidoreductase [Micromonospora sp. HUAS LYJ1]WKU03542.1 FAD-dependent oxidoreductase [Micromonospora sp. HUAS LYJ1]